MRASIRGMFVAGAVALAPALTACEEEGPAEQVGESIDESAEEAGEAVEEAGDELRDATN
jgi:hypothetical protein